MVFWDVAVDEVNGTVRDKFICSSCGAELSKRDCTRSKKNYYDERLEKNLSIAKQVPVQITYLYNGKRYEKKPDTYDMELYEKIENTKIPYWYPIDELPYGYNTEQPKKSHGFDYVHQFYVKSNLYVLAKIAHFAKDKPGLYSLIGDLLPRASKMHKIAVSRLNTSLSKTAGILSGTLYIPSNSIAYSAIEMLKSRAADVINFMRRVELNKDCLITNQSATAMNNIPDNSIDYIFTDPPFGDNLMYSEINYIWESWLKIKTANNAEAIINATQGKGIEEYKVLMTDVFKEYYRTLKPNRWMTVEFHNSKNAVWNVIQEALQISGFIVADVRTLNKKQGSFKQVTSTVAVKQDLVISAYKPGEELKILMMSNIGNVNTAWAFVSQHLEKLPSVVIVNEKIEIIAERQAFLLFDRMVAYHIINGLPVPIDAISFYKGLNEKYLKRDDMYFLSDQVNEYDTARITSDVEPIQFELFVTNEKSAIAWLYQQLDKKQTYAELQPQFMQEIKSIDKYEKMSELSVLLAENFLQDANGKWYIPDVSREADIIKLREKKLWKDFQGYTESKGKLKSFRAEAVRVGFARLWSERNYQLIVDTAERLPESVLQEDDKLLMYYDISLGRV